MPDISPSAPEPQTPQPAAGVSNAADLIRSKLDRIYAIEPDASTELEEAEAVASRSPHQEFMHQLSHSGKDLATIQTEWHNYYVQLDDQAKHQVWQEFYSTNTQPTGPTDVSPIQQPMAPGPIDPQVMAKHKNAARSAHSFKKKRASAPRPRRDLRSPQAIRAAIRDQVTANGTLQPKHHLQALLFGLGVGAVVVFIFLFGFFNEVIIAPFIQPSRSAVATPIIVDSSSVAATTTPQVIIPKINVQIPTDYSQTTTDEASIENALESGIVHYPTTALPGQQGNAAFFGHSSNNIFNKGKYKFAFVLLHLMVPGDTFYLSYNSKVYVYKVITKTVVDPSQVEVLNAVPGQTATATLITCDPPGTSLKRLVVVGQQISPDPSGNVAGAAQPTLGATSTSLPGNGPTLAGRLFGSAVGKFIGTLLIIGAIVVTLRWVNKPRS
ncbi:MAG: sortase [Patescibacteria group bacterium]|nr:sortase [Patescibacteria group bacterium]